VIGVLQAHVAVRRAARVVSAQQGPLSCRPRVVVARAVEAYESTRVVCSAGADVKYEARCDAARDREAAGRVDAIRREVDQVRPKVEMKMSWTNPRRRAGLERESESDATAAHRTVIPTK